MDKHPFLPEYIPQPQVGQVPMQDPGYDLFNPPSDTYMIIRELLNDELAEALKKSPLWPVLSKSFILSFIDDTQAKKLEMLFESYVCKWLRTLPPNAQENGAIVDAVQQVRWLFLSNLNRARGTLSSGKINERTAQISQMSFGMSTVTQHGQQSGGSFMGRMLGRFKR